MFVIFALLSGLLFGAGLVLSGLADPQKVLAFLDIAGAWDPSLALVMTAAVAVAAWPFARAKRRNHSLLGAPMQLPTARHIDRPLLVGSLLFGVGWGLVGLCPGPALLVLESGQTKAVVFFLAMASGMAVHHWRTPLLNLLTGRNKA